MDNEQIYSLLTALENIERRLGTIAAYASHLHTESIGERTYRIDGYVRTTTSQGDDAVWLYCPIPGMKYRVTTVYAERFDELPFDPVVGKLFDGEVAPSRGNAEQKSYFNRVAIFEIATLPTGKKTEEGKDVYRFSRIIGGTQRNPVNNGNGQNSDPTPESRPVPVQRRVEPTQPQPDQPAERQTQPTNGKWVTASPARVVRRGEMPPDVLRQWLCQEAKTIKSFGRTPSDAQVGAVHSALVKCTPGEEQRRALQVFLTGHNSMANMDPEQVLALFQWLRPSKNGPTDPDAATEIGLVIAQLDYVAETEATTPTIDDVNDKIANDVY